MSRRRVWLGGGAAAALMVAVGIAINQVLNNDVWSWPWFAAAVVFAAATVVVGRRMAVAEQPRPLLRPDLADTKSHPLLVSEVTPRRLGVHRSRFGPEGDSPYVERDADEALADALSGGERRLIVVQGPRLAGATSTLAQAAQTHLAGHRVLAFVDDPRITVAQMVAAGRRWAGDGPGAVLWLDDLTPARLGQLDDELLGGLPSGMWILATVHDKHLKGLRVPEQVRAQLEERAVVVRLGTISGREREKLRTEDAYTALLPVLDAGDDLLMGRLMVALDQIQNALTLGQDEESTGQIALLRAITDWYRVGMPTLLTRQTLEELYAAYWREITGQGHDRPLSATRFERALSWATAKGSRERPQLVDLEQVDKNAMYAPHPLVAVVADDTGQPGAWQVADALWAYANRFLTGDQRRDIGYTALDQGDFPHARTLLGHDDTQIDLKALLQVAYWLDRTNGNATAARRWYKKVVATDHADLAAVTAMFFLGVLEAGQGDIGQARRWYGETIATGNTDLAPRAMYNLGILEEEQGDLAQARRWYGEAIATGNTDDAPRAMIALGNLEKEQGDLAQARRWYGEAIATGHTDLAPRAMYNLAVLEEEQSDLAQARRWYGEAIATGHADDAPRAMINLAVLEEKQGDLAQARHWTDEAIATGHADQAPKAMVNLGWLEYHQSNLGAARHWWEQAIATGHADEAPHAMASLGNLDDEQGDLVQARHWHGEAIATGHADHAPRAMVSLGNVEMKQGNVTQARHRWKQAIDTDHADAKPCAMNNLGVVEEEQGDIVQARHWYGEAIATGNAKEAPRAMLALGDLEEKQGDIVQARHWYGEAIATGHPELAERARQALRDLERRQDERRRAERFGQYGYLAYADPDLMKPSGTGPSSEQSSIDEDEPSPQ